MGVVGTIKLILFVLTSLPSVVKALKELYELVTSDKKLAKECLNEICNPEHLKLHVDRLNAKQ